MIVLMLFPFCMVEALELRKDAVILAFGDSLTVGIGGSGIDYPNQLGKLIRREIINAGSSGELTAQGIARLEETLNVKGFDFLIICHGINDLYRKVPISEIKKNLAQMIRSAHNKDIPVILIALPDPTSRRLHPLFKEVANETGAILDSHSLVSVFTNPLYKADPVHLNREGYIRLAENVSQFLSNRHIIKP